MVKNFRISLVLISATIVFGLLASAALVNGDQGPAAAFADQRDALAAAVGWIMTEQQNDDGGFGVGFDTGKPQSSVASTLDAIIAVAAAGYNPGATYFGAQQSALGYLQAHGSDLVAFAESSGGANGKVILALTTANVDPRGFNGHDFVASLLGRFDSGTGSYNNTTAFNQALSVLALANVGEPIPEEAAAWIVNNQNPNGSWADGYGTFDNPDSTAMAIMALQVSGTEDTVGDSVAKGLDFLASSQFDTAGWSYGDAYPENVNSTALVVQALAAAGEDFYSNDGKWAKNGRSPLTALLAQQSASGAFLSDSNTGKVEDFFATVQAIPAVTGKPFPLPSRLMAVSQSLACLEELQDEISGGWEQFTGFGVNAAGTARAIEAIAAAGSDPKSSRWTAGDINAVDSLANDTPSYLMDTRGGRPGVVAQAVAAAGNPYKVTDFAGHDLLADISASLAPDGTLDDISFGIMAHAEAMMGLLVADSVIDPAAVKYLINSETDGNWDSPDNSGIALNVLGRIGFVKPSALRYLQSTQQPDGGWGFDLPSDASSTSEVVQGLRQQGENPFSPRWSQIKQGAVQSPADAIMARQKENGCWPNYNDTADDPFGTTDAIIMLTIEPEFVTFVTHLPIIGSES